MTKPQTNNINTNQANRLSVQINLTGLSFLVTSQEKAVIAFVEREFDTIHTPAELLYEFTTIISEEKALQGTFQNVSLIYTTRNYSLVPSSLFDEQKASEYLKFNTKILGNDYISHDEIENNHAVVVYVPFVNINNYVFEQYGSFQYFHATTLLVSEFLKLEKHAQTTKVYLHIIKDQFECIVITNGELQLCNSYEYKTPQDFIYYVLFCLEQLKLNPDSIETVLCGSISEGDALHDILYTYVRNVTFLEGSYATFSINEDKPHEHILLKTLI